MRQSEPAHLRVPSADIAVVLQSPFVGVGRLIGEEALRENDRPVFRVDSDKQHKMHAVPANVTMGLVQL